MISWAETHRKMVLTINISMKAGEDQAVKISSRTAIIDLIAKGFLTSHLWDSVCSLK